jgi:hypothetical protein
MDDAIVNRRPRGIATDDKALVLQRLPGEPFFVGQAMALQQHGEDPRLPQNGGVAMRRQDSSGKAQLALVKYSNLYGQSQGGIHA